MVSLLSQHMTKAKFSTCLEMVMSMMKAVTSDLKRELTTPQPDPGGDRVLGREPTNDIAVRPNWMKRNGHRRQKPAFEWHQSKGKRRRKNMKPRGGSRKATEGPTTRQNKKKRRKAGGWKIVLALLPR